ncbi:MAG: hypothetical protein H7Y13_13750, partial [Sphingobacteriaceae bacterium]|nr:hypothetical protein [Sphingobacteriaceae bacterium]
MKKIITTAFATIVAVCGYSQTNTFPSDGNVGIGTPTPSYKLDVNGTSRFSQFIHLTSNDQEVQFYRNGSVYGYIWSDALGLNWGKGSRSNSISINNQGNLGIGVSANNAKLEVVATTGEVFRADAANGAYRIVANQGGVDLQGIINVNGALTGTLATFNAQGTASAGTVNLVSPDAFLRLNSTNGSPDKQKWDIRAISASGYEGLEFRTINDANNVFSSKMFINHQGHVGIGTTTPVVAGSGYTGLDIRGGGGGSLILGSPANIGAYVFANQSDFYVETPGFIALRAGGDIERFRITSDGNVGIGTANPGAKLELFESEPRMYFNGTRASDPRKWEIGSEYIDEVNGMAFAIRDMTTSGSPIRMAVNKDGNIAIGTTNPQGYKLAVAGKIRATEIKVEALPWPDYVFEKSYKLLDLKSTEQFINENKRLPEIPSAAQVAKEGINLGEMNAKLL